MLFCLKWLFLILKPLKMFLVPAKQKILNLLKDMTVRILD